MLENKLRQKGIDKDLIKDCLDNDYEEDIEFELCKKQVKKYLESKDMSKPNAEEKIIVSLIRKGFKIDMVKKIIKMFYLYNDNDAN